MDEAGFRQAFGTSPTRLALLTALDEAFADLSSVIEPACCLVGGSFIDPAQSAPRDLDLVVFYRVPATRTYEPGRALLRLSRKFLLKSIDTRFVPYDSEPWLLVKLASFFTSLYHSDRKQPGHQRGLVLFIPRTRRRGEESTHAQACLSPGIARHSA